MGRAIEHTYTCKIIKADSTGRANDKIATKPSEYETTVKDKKGGETFENKTEEGIRKKGFYE